MMEKSLPFSEVAWRCRGYGFFGGADLFSVRTTRADAFDETACRHSKCKIRRRLLVTSLEDYS